MGGGPLAKGETYDVRTGHAVSTDEALEAPLDHLSPTALPSDDLDAVAGPASDEIPSFGAPESSPLLPPLPLEPPLPAPLTRPGDPRPRRAESWREARHRRKQRRREIKDAYFEMAARERLFAEYFGCPLSVVVDSAKDRHDAIALIRKAIYWLEDGQYR